MTVNFAHCFFEQSGTFKRAFRELGIAANDYDIQNQFGETDIICDLFFQIERAYRHKRSIFDNISTDDIILAFFPCIYFCDMSSMFFMGVQYNQRNLTQLEKIQDILVRERKRHEYYVILLKLFAVCEDRRLRMILENPYSAHHYLRFNFPYKPAVIDMNRRLKGDTVKKPTQYFFLNCKPAGKVSMQFDKPQEFIKAKKCSAKAGICSAERSQINPDYAHNFICDHILGIESGHTLPTLFD